MLDLKILVATHKKYWMPKDSIHLPIHVGRANTDDLGYLGDDTGENISSKNPNYCELTALYWAWKNLKCDYIGLCHYRRYFAHSKLNEDIKKGKKFRIYRRKDYEQILKTHDIILPKKRYLYIESVKSHYANAHNRHDLNLARGIISRLCPEYLGAFDKVMAQKSMYILNMFVMKFEDFSRYCEWLFPILFELEKRRDLRSYDEHQARIFGFLSERLFNVWIKNENFKIKAASIVNLEKVSHSKKAVNLVRRKFAPLDREKFKVKALG